jgi:hypothetical protein
MQRQIEHEGIVMLFALARASALAMLFGAVIHPASTHTADASIQAICQAGLHQHRGPKAHTEFSHGHATQAVDEGALG